MMDAKTQSHSGRKPAAARAPHDGHGPEHRDDHGGSGIDLPVVGHVPVESMGFLVGLGIAGAVGVIDWPVVAAVGIGYALARKKW